CNSGTNYRGRMSVKVDEEGIFRPVARRSTREVSIKAQLVHLGGCRDGFTSAGYQGGGAFTIALCKAWQGGVFTGTFKDLHSRICELISSSQRPQYNEYGPVSEDFQNQRAFSVPSPLPVEGFIQLPVIEMSPTEAEISHPGEKHNYTFSAVKAGKYTIETAGRTDLVMRLYGPDSETKLITQDDDSGIGMNAKISVDLQPGIYYVRAQHYNSDRGTGGYSIKVTK
ncbi:hypothetical protein KA005_25305, partial [bacterium]|nr:hypothetical protein [bacterium]